MTTEVSIITNTDSYVKRLTEENAPVKHQVRVQRGVISARDIDPAQRARGRNIARCCKRNQRVRVPAMRGSEWDHLLRTLELKRACA
ncbi:hypothetical protein PMPD1_4427 (plasmid) [Paramixta manurensis]|uniref:Uncharacterized protein n=1 Tax=Paramixta manurensis TaxID=2740817 RepID=A0A6M8UFI9_9GAMM|nr:hypothetical protein PMPD1_4427 [Erwiniaceae bacterium PD-1]